MSTPRNRAAQEATLINLRAMMKRLDKLEKRLTKRLDAPDRREVLRQWWLGRSR